ncbi:MULTISPECIES: GNAT family N-acetyltransferase [unclassified Sinorhizobium]|uniref:GNAT family N-acetyltransferase n=1 Tax=unclassified Sinorhizobium TaxID=2613772 RepID=UPI0024C45FF9|nr:MULTISPECIES: GNAT family N-acetyltransferase [unclassified Sinorhizobium]MDK1375723.1 GNAT family N-acetyltransferase [Sinorhizobium sp. 6-70]MDK1479651.1 GNAT family N-acetyltransferase [Sinorhizobium sp. 6-117]
MTDEAPGELEIRRFAAEDEQGVIDVILPIQREEFGIAITIDDQPDLHSIPAFYQSGIGDFWVATAGDRVVGTLGLKDIGGSQAAIRKMFVAPDFRGRSHGVAARLFESLLVHAERRKIAALFLGTTDKFLAAHRFYEKNGFAEITKDDLPAGFPVMSVDTKFYVRRLASAA